MRVLVDDLITLNRSLGQDPVVAGCQQQEQSDTEVHFAHSGLSLLSVSLTFLRRSFECLLPLYGILRSSCSRRVNEIPLGPSRGPHSRQNRAPTACASVCMPELPRDPPVTIS